MLELENAPLGATLLDGNRAFFRVWAPRCRTVDVELAGEPVRYVPLARVAGGYFDAIVPQVTVGDRYKFRLNGRESRPDPVSRYQPEGVHGPSQIVDASRFRWTDQAWSGVAKADLVIYELHVGAFTKAGTYRAAIERLPQLVELGVTAVELMPVAQSPGRWNWGYDGVNLFAPRNTFGTPDELRAFVDACHRAGLAVIMDVVYNHLGPEGNYLAEFGPYFTSKYNTPWGPAVNFDSPRAKPVRQFVVENAVYWLRDFHLDGLRLDAVHFMFDDRPRTILDEVRAAVSDHEAKGQRALHLIAEANVYEPELLPGVAEERPSYDAIWADCLMHSIYAQGAPELDLTHREYTGGETLAEALRHGCLYTGSSAERLTDGQRHDYGLIEERAYLSSLVVALQTHDSVGNHPHGHRIHQIASLDFQRAAAALVLLYPGIPLLFMGEEFACDSPFPFFVDFEDKDLNRAIDRGRPREYPQHDWRGAPRPSAAGTFAVANCDGSERNEEMSDWYRRLLSLRREGVRLGWLNPRDYSATYDAAASTIEVRYTGYSIFARLLPPVEAEITPLVALDLDDAIVLLDSRNDSATTGSVMLYPNHATVVRWTSRS